MEEKNINSLVINKVESQSVYDSMVAANKINDDELYLVAGNDSQTSGVTGVKGAAETSYRTGDVNITAENIGALPADTIIPSKTSDLTNDSGFITSAPVTSVNNKTGAVQITADNVGAVPTTRTINGKTLSSNITLTASDVNAASESTPTTITIPTSAWGNNYCTRAVSGVTASSNIIVTAAPTSYIAYAKAGVRCTTQSSGALSFACEKTPTDDLSVNVLIVG